MMQRLTTDNPTSNLSSLLNIAYVGDDERVKLRYADGQEDVDLCEFMAQMIAADSSCTCKPTAEHILDGCCLDCDCEYGYLYAVATQAAELRYRLMEIEDILGAEYDLDYLRKLLATSKCEQQIITNADSVHSMSDGELADFLDQGACSAIYRGVTGCPQPKLRCRDCIQRWLQQKR